jgi:hypothetical protein
MQSYMVYIKKTYDFAKIYHLKFGFNINYINFASKNED